MRRRKSGRSCARLAAIPANEERVLLATGRYIGEGFDDARLDTLFLTLPVSWRGTIAQYVGRLHRLHDRKREVRVYDYADLNVPMLARMFDRRCRGYEAVGYTILLPASAVPGWPADVPLPVDPQWKNDYAASVRRLVRDGVDPPLANLFVHAARNVPPDAEGSDRARSATRGISLPAAGNAAAKPPAGFASTSELPIPFDGWGNMEVDLLCAEARVAVELDGGQHLADAEAYRRDRRKDRSLQENGYFVLRFLAEDVGKQLDMVLDAILRTLAHRGQQRTSPHPKPSRGRGTEPSPLPEGEGPTRNASRQTPLPVLPRPLPCSVSSLLPALKDRRLAQLAADGDELPGVHQPVGAGHRQDRGHRGGVFPHGLRAGIIELALGNRVDRGQRGFLDLRRQVQVDLLGGEFRAVIARGHLLAVGLGKARRQSGGRLSDPGQHALRAGDQVAQLPGDMVHARHGPQKQIGIGQVLHVGVGDPVVSARLASECESSTTLRFLPWVRVFSNLVCNPIRLRPESPPAAEGGIMGIMEPDFLAGRPLIEYPCRWEYTGHRCGRGPDVRGHRRNHGRCRP